MAELGRLPGKEERRGEEAAAVGLELISAAPCCPLSPAPLGLLQGHTPWPDPRNQGVRTRLRGRKGETREGRKDITKEREKQS